MNNILAVNLILNCIILIIGARMLILPRIDATTLHIVAVPILLFHGMRHLGLMFLAPGISLPGLPPLFAYTAAIGDCISALLAMIALYKLHHRTTHMMRWLWVFNVFGSLDFLVAITLSRVTNGIPYLGAAYWIPGFFVPLLIMAHYVLFVQLRRVKAVPDA